jgi:hypothetical protein
MILSREERVEEKGTLVNYKKKGENQAEQRANDAFGLQLTYVKLLALTKLQRRLPWRVSDTQRKKNVEEAGVGMYTTVA